MAVAISLHSPLLPEVNCVVIFAMSSNLLYQRPVDRSSGRTMDAAAGSLRETFARAYESPFPRSGLGIKVRRRQDIPILVMGYGKLLWCRLQRI